MVNEEIDRESRELLNLAGDLSALNSNKVIHDHFDGTNESDSIHKLQNKRQSYDHTTSFHASKYEMKDDISNMNSSYVKPATPNPPQRAGKAN